MIIWKWSSTIKRNTLRHQRSVTDLAVVVDVAVAVVVAVDVAVANKVFLFIYRHSVEFPK